MSPRPAASPWRALLGALAVLAGVVACSGIITGPDGGPDTRPRSIMVAPSQMVLVPNDTARLTPSLFDVTGAATTVEPGQAIRYVSLDPSIAMVDSTGLVTGIADGATTVRAEYGALGLGIPVRVLARPRLVVVSGDAQSGEQGDTLPLALVVRALDPAGQPVANVAVSFSASIGGGSITAADATTDASGLADARWVLGLPLGPQLVAVHAAGYDSVTFLATATAGTRVVRVDLLPSDSVLVGAGDTTTIPRRAYNVADVELPNATFAWSSSALAVATVAPTGQVTSVAPGAAYIKATSGTGADSVLFTVLAPPSIGIAPETLSFITNEGTSPAPQAFDITNAGGDRLTGLSISIAYGAGASGWLSVALDSTAAPLTVPVTPATDALVAGDYTATITIASSRPNVASREVTVQLSVQGSVPLPKLDLGPDIDHSAQLQARRSLTIPTNASGPVLVTLRTTDVSGLLLSAGASVVGSEQTQVEIEGGTNEAQYWMQGMVGGSERTVNVVAEAVGYAPDTLVILTRRPMYRLRRFETESVPATGGADPVFVLELGDVSRFTGEWVPMAVSVGVTAPVFTLQAEQPTIGLVQHFATPVTSGGDQGPAVTVTFAVQPEYNSTSSGQFVGTPASLRLARTGVAGSASVHVTAAPPEWDPVVATLGFTLTGPEVPIILVAPDAPVLASTAGSVVPATSASAITNAGVGTLDGLAVDVLYGAGASDWLLVTLDGTTAPTTLRFAASAEFLAAGTYTATVTVSSTVSGVDPVDVPVILTVEDGPRIVIVSGDGQQVEWGEIAPDSLKVRVLQADGTPLGDAFVSFTVSSNGGSVLPTDDVTDENGYVATRWRMSEQLGTHTVTVRRAGYRSAVFTGTAIAGTYVTRVAITASRLNFSSIGDSERFSADAYNLADSLITSKSFLWESTDLAVATVDDSGTVSIVGAGTTYIRASVNDGIDSVLVTVTLPLPVGLSIVSGDAQSATVGTALAAPVVIRYIGIGGAPVSGASLRVQGIHGCCNPFLDSTVTTDAAGLASIRPTMPTVASPATFTVSVVGAPTVTNATFTATPLPGAAVALQFSLNTGGGNAGSIIAPGWVVRAMDAFSNTATAFTGPITVALFNGPTGITTLGGTTTRNAVAGVATFNDLTVNVAATSWVLLATSPGLATAGSAAFSIGIPFDFTLVNTPLVALGGTATVRAISGVPAYGAGFVVSLAPSNGAILGVNAPATVTIPPGDSVATWTIVGLSTGTTFLNLTRDGAGAGQISVTVSSNTISVPLILNAPYTRTTSLPINLTQPAPAGGTTLTVTSSDPAIVTVLTPTVTIAAGTLSANAQLEGRTLGEAAVLVSGPALATGVSTVRVTAALDFIETSTSLNANFNTATVRARLLSGGTVFPAPVGGIPLAFVSRDPACVAAPTATSVPAGANTIDVVLEYGGSAATTCSTRIIVSSSSFDSDSVSVTVNPQPTSTLSVTPRIAAGLVRQGTVSLGAASPPGGTLVSLASSDSTRLLLSPDDATVGHGTLELTIPPGSFSASFWYAGVEGQGGTTATISGTAARYVAPLARDITIDTLGVEFSGSTSLTTLGGDGGGTVVLGSITGAAGSQSVINESVVRAGGSSYAVTVTSTSPAVAVPVVAGVAAATRVVTIGPGQSRASVGIRPLTSGTTTFQATAPAVISPVRAGYPGTITITQPTTALSVTPRIAAGLVRQGTLSIGAASPPGGTVFTLASSDSTRLLLSPDAETVGHGTLDLTIPAGQFSISFWYAGVEDQGGTTATISGTVPGGLYSDPTPRDITIDTLGVELSGSSSLTTLGGDGSGTAILGSISTSGTNQSVINESVVRAGGRTYTVTVTSTAPAVAIPVVAGTAGASRTVTIAPGQSRAGFGIRPLTSGTTTFTGTAPDVVTPSRVGYPATITITQPTVALSVTPRIAAGLVRQGSISLGAASPPGGTVIALSSSDSTRLLLSSDASTIGHGTLDVTIPAGQFSASIWYAGVEDQGGTTATISATVPGGLYSAPAPRDIAIDTLGVEASGSTSLTTLGGDGNGTVTLGSISTSGANQSVINESVVRAGGRTYTVTLTSTTPTVAVPVVAAVAASPRIVTIGPGQSRANFGIRPLVAGTTTFTATAPDAVTPVRTGYPATLTVVSPSSSISLSPRVGAGLAMQGTVSFAVAIPAGGATVTLTSSDPTRLLVARDFTSAGAAQITIPVNQGQFSTSFVVMGLEDVTGSPTVTAQTAGFTDAIATVAVEPIGVQWSGTSSLTTLAGDGSGTVYLGIITGVAGNRSVSPEQVIRTGGVSRTITLTTSAPSVVLPVVAGVAQQGISVTILPGESRASVGVRPIGAGVATIAPSGAGLVSAETPTVPQTVTVTVPRISLSLSGTTVGSGLAQAGTLSFESGIPVGGLTLTLTSTDSSLLRLAPDGSTAGTGQLVLPLTAGTFSRAITMMALEGVTGSVGITATITGYRDTTFAITVVAPAVALDGPPATRTISAGDIAFQALVGVPVGNGVRQQLVRFGAPAPLTVTLTSSAPTVGTLVIGGVAGSPAALTIPVGESSTSNVVATRANFRPLTSGNATITATIPGFVQQGDAIRTVTVTP